MIQKSEDEAENNVQRLTQTKAGLNTGEGEGNKGWAHSYYNWGYGSSPQEDSALKKIEDENNHPVYNDMVKRFLGSSAENKDKYHKMWKDHYA